MLAHMDESPWDNRHAEERAMARKARIAEREKFWKMERRRIWKRRGAIVGLVLGGGVALLGFLYAAVKVVRAA